jgi:hypothetical protein
MGLILKYLLEQYVGFPISLSYQGNVQSKILSKGSFLLLPSTSTLGLVCSIYDMDKFIVAEKS